MLIAILELLIAPLAILVAIIWFGRQAQRWHSMWVWSRYVRAARAHNRSGRFLDDRRPRDPGVVDAEFEEVER